MALSDLDSTAVVQDICLLAAKALAAAKERRYQTSICILRRVLRKKQEALAKLSQTSKWLNGLVTPNSLEVQKVPLRDSFDCSQSFFAEQRAFSIYDSAFLVHASSTDVMKTQTAQVIVLSAVLYNFGLIYHLRAMTNSLVEQQVMLSAALQYYDLAWQSVSSIHDEWPCFSLAITNNIAHIYLLRGDFVEATSSIDTLNWLLKTTHRVCNDDLMSSFFHTNVALFRAHPPQTLPAPSA